MAPPSHVIHTTSTLVDRQWRQSYMKPGGQSWQVPANSGISHYNFKGTYSIVALIVVDTCYRITLVDCGGQGRISDSGMN
ncbi:hypothetical protein ANCDUO_00149 [Ancylostoma duodenale]|uniref:Uncharacterized protein n=1 Tax=Ancylostoma duodenale TaxID=51022 RepID=A0A0C2H6L4_9BILA|nr:hypothetical protein ANCDUO_00149 [Ancylostoma duodenale]